MSEPELTPATALAKALMNNPDHHITAWAASAVQRLTAAGFAIVPVVPTEAMLDAAPTNHLEAHAVWTRMLQAAR